MYELRIDAVVKVVELVSLNVILFITGYTYNIYNVPNDS